MSALSHVDTERPAPQGLPLLSFLVLFVIFYVIDGFDLFYAMGQRDAELGMGSAVSLQAGGSAGRRLAFLLLAGLGIFGVLWPRVEDARLRGLLGGLLIVGTCYIAISPAWADNPSMGLRRSGAMLFLALGVIGASRRWTMRQVLLFALLIPATTTVLGLASEIATGRFSLLTLDYRFHGIMHANRNGGLIGIMILAALCVMRSGGGRRMLWLAFVAAAFALLITTQSRGALAALLAALATWWAFRGGELGRGFGAALLAGGLVVPLGFLAFGESLSDVARSAMFLGRVEDASPATLTGRMPLWEYLIERHAADRPWLGHGYGSFWTAQRLLDVSEYFRWTIFYSHSGYIEVLLDLGVIGLALMVAAIGAALFRALHLYRTRGESEWLFAAAILVWHMVNSIVDAIAPYPELRTFLVLLIAVKVAMTPVSEERAGVSVSRRGT